MLLLLWLIPFAIASRQRFDPGNPFRLSPVDRKYATFTKRELEESTALAKEMFYFGYSNYMEHAFPADELDPIHCRGRGHDHKNPSNININDVLGDYSLTLVDTLDSLVVFGDPDEFKKAVHLVIETVSFDRNTTVQVFEATIRVMGSLLSAHLIATDKNRTLGDFYIEGYNGELLTMAQDLANRLMPAFRGTATGLPFTRVNLQKGVLPSEINETCTAGAGSLLLEFGVLSRLLGDETYEAAARQVNEYLWSQREGTGLLGSLINIQTGMWTSNVSGLGAGSDSFYEYLLKAFIMFGDEGDLTMYNEVYASIIQTMRRGRYRCHAGIGEFPLYVNVDSRDGATANTWIDSLQASFAGVLVLSGDLEEALCAHIVHYAIWRRYGVLPERFNWQLRKTDVDYYPLRPEFAESTYLLYQATKNPFYLNVGREILDSINGMTRVKCGFATIHDVNDGSLEDRMESFFLAETMKYLYLLFDLDNPVNLNQERLIFTTEGHIFPVNEKFQRKPEEIFKKRQHRKARKYYQYEQKKPPARHPDEPIYKYMRQPQRNTSCETSSSFQPFRPPLTEWYMGQLFELVGMPGSWWS